MKFVAHKSYLALSTLTLLIFPVAYFCYKVMTGSNSSPSPEFFCLICCKITSKRFTNADKCSHPFCTDCMLRYIRVNLYENLNISVCIKCPGSKCRQMLDPFACAPLIGHKWFVRWMDMLCEEALVGLEKCYCPYKNCSELILNECGKDPKKSRCPSCKRWFCFHCKSVWHASFRCEEMIRCVDDEDLTFERLVESEEWKRCPGCKHFVERIDGCQNMRCRCGIRFCYNCGDENISRRCSCYS